MKSLLIVTGIAALLGAGSPARANQTFDFTFSGSDDLITGQLTTTNLNGDAYTIIGVTGTIDGVQIAGLAPVGSFVNPNFVTDNLLYASGALVDSGGFIIDPVASSGSAAQLAPEQIQETLLLGSTQPGVFSYDVTFSGSAALDMAGSFSVENVTAVPEPGTVALLGVGLLGLGVMRRRVL